MSEGAGVFGAHCIFSQARHRATVTNEESLNV